MLTIAPSGDINHQIDTSAPNGEGVLREMNYQKKLELEAEKNKRIIETKECLKKIWNWLIIRGKK